MPAEILLAPTPSILIPAREIKVAGGSGAKPRPTEGKMFPRGVK